MELHPPSDVPLPSQGATSAPASVCPDLPDAPPPHAERATAMRRTRTARAEVTPRFKASHRHRRGI